MPAVTFSGLASGIDADAIIKALIDAQKVQQLPLQNRVESNKTENKALDDLNTKLLGLSDTLRGLMTVSGGSVSKIATSSDQNSLGVTAGSNAIPSSTTIEILSLAKNTIVSFPDTFSAPDAPMFPGLGGPTSLDITVGSGSTAETKSFAVDNTTSLADLLSKINDQLGGKVRASAVNVGSGTPAQYKLVINSLKTGELDGALSITVPPDIAALGGLQNPLIQQSEDAVVRVQGLGDVRRSSNQINDLIPGVTLDLKQAGTGPLTVSVANDTDATAKKLNDVVTAFNEIVKYGTDNDKVERVEKDNKVSNTYGSLAKTNIDEQLTDALRAALSGSNSGVVGSAVRIFADLGVTTQRDGTLAFDSAKFTEAVAKDPIAAERLLSSFADKVASTNGVVYQYTKFQGIIEQAKSSNDSENNTTTDRLDRMNDFIEKQTTRLRLTFANLEKRTAELQAGASSLVSLMGTGSSK